MSSKRIVAMLMVVLMLIQSIPVSAFEGSGWQEVVSDEYTNEYCTVRFLAEGEEAAEEYVDVGMQLGSIPEAPEREGLTFAGWYADGEEITENTVIRKDMEVRAVYLSPETDAAEIPEAASGAGTFTGEGDSYLEADSAAYLAPETHEIGEILAKFESKGVKISVLYGSVPETAEASVRQYSQDETDTILAAFGIGVPASRSANTSSDNTATGYTAFDVSIQSVDGEVYHGDGLYSVSVDLDFDVVSLVPEGARLTGVEYEVYHLKGEEVEKLEATVEGKTVSFSTESFSPFMLQYTVDFSYEGIDYSIPGNSQILASELFRILNVHSADMQEVDGILQHTILDVKDVAEIVFTDEHLVKVEQVSGLIKYNDGEVDVGEKDFLLTSLEPFSSNEKLTIKLVDGREIVIDVTDDQGINLLSIAPSVNVSAITSTQDVARDAKLDLNLNFKITDADKIALAKENTPWEYDLSTIVGNDKVFDEIMADASGLLSGALYDGNTRSGTYEVVGNKIIITPDPTWLEGRTVINCTLQMTAQLNKEVNSTLTENEISFPGGGKIKVEFEEKTLTTNKTVGPNPNYQQSHFDYPVEVTKNADGTFNLYYELTVTPNTDLTTLFLNDTLSAGQTYITNSAKVYVNNQLTAEPVNFNGSSFDMATYLATASANGTPVGGVKGGDTIKLTYAVKVSADYLNSSATPSESYKHLTNTSVWNWDMGIKTNDTDIIPKFDEKLETDKKGSLDGYYWFQNGGKMQAQRNQDGTFTLYWTVKATPNSATKLTLVDTINGPQTLDLSSVELYKDGVKVDNPSYNTSTSNGNTALNVTVATDSNPTTPNSSYEVRYQTTITEADLGTLEKNTAVWTWNGDNKSNEASVTPVFNKTITPTKSGDVNAVKIDSNTYELTWTITARTNVDAQTLVVKDNFGSDQTLVTDSLTLYVNGESNGPVNPTVSGDEFTVNVHSYVSGGIKADTEYKIVYKTRITKDKLDTNIPNIVDWTWTTDGNTPETPGHIETGVTPEYIPPQPNPPSDKTVDKTVAKPDDILTFTIHIGGMNDGESENTNLAGLMIKDFMSMEYGTVTDSTGTPVSYVTMSPKPAAAGTGDSLQIPLDNADGQLFHYQFDPDVTDKGEYTITYYVKVKNDPEVMGKRYIPNSVQVGNVTHSTNTEIDYGSPTAEKSFLHWDENESAAEPYVYWAINVDVPEGRTLHSVIINEADGSGKSAADYGWGNNSWADMTFDWSKVEIKAGEDVLTKSSTAGTWTDGQYTGLSENSYYVDEAANKIYFSSLNKDITVTLASKSPVSYDTYRVFYVKNEASLTYNDNQNIPLYAENSREKNSYKMTKSGSLDQDTGIITWVVVINPDNSKIDPDHMPYFMDELPEGTILCDAVGADASTIHVKLDAYTAGTGVPNYNAHGNVPNGDTDISVIVDQNEIQPVNLTELGNGDYNPTGVSGMHYTITYYTKFTSEQLAQMKKDADYYSFTNIAYETDSNGSPLKEADATVEYKYSDIVKKEDITGGLTALYGNTIRYRVEANPEYLRLNDGKMVTLTDQISTDVSLLANTVTIEMTDSDGNPVDASEAIIGYNDDTRILEIHIPDETKAIVEFDVKALQTGEKLYKNTVVLKCNITQVVETEEKHVVTSSGGILEGDKGTITVHKYDQYNINKNLAGAKFKVYRVETEPVVFDGLNDDGTQKYVSGGQIIEDADGNPVMHPLQASGNEGTTDYEFDTDEHGLTVFSGIIPYTLYCWIETKAPNNYVITSSVPHYFVTYESGEGEEVNKYRAWSLDDAWTAVNGITIASIREAYTWPVTNVEDTQAKATLEGSKTMIGRDMKANEFSFVLRDADDPRYPILQTVRNTQGANGEIVPFSFAPIVYQKADTYHYTITEQAAAIEDGENIVYDTAVYDVTVVVGEEEVGGKKVLTAPVITYVKNGQTVAPRADYVNRKNETSLTLVKTVVGAELTEAQKQQISFHVVSNDSENPFDETYTYDTFVNGMKTLKASDGIVEGVTYTVTETVGKLDGKDSFTYTIVNGVRSATTGAANEGATATVITNDKASTVEFVNEYRPETIKVKILKKWMGQNGFTTNPVNATMAYFNIYRVEGNTETKVNSRRITVSAATDWEWESEDLPLGIYRIEEVDRQGNPITEVSYWTAGQGLDGNSEGKTLGEKTYGNTVETVNPLTNFSLTKAWENLDGSSTNPASSVEVQLTQTVDNVTTDVVGAVFTLNDGNSWNVDINNLATKTINGQDITYGIRETKIVLKEPDQYGKTQYVGDEIQKHYTAVVTDGAAGEKTITNTEKEFGLKVTKQYVYPDGTDANGQKTDPIYFVINAKLGTNWTVGYKAACANANGTYTINWNSANNTWSTVDIGELPDKINSGTGIADDAGNAVIDYSIVETDSNGTALATGATLTAIKYYRNYGKSSQEEDSTVTQTDSGTITIENTIPKDREITLTKEWFDVFGNPAEKTDTNEKVYVRIVVNYQNGDNTSELTYSPDVAYQPTDYTGSPAYNADYGQPKFIINRIDENDTYTWDELTIQFPTDWYVYNNPSNKVRSFYFVEIDDTGNSIENAIFKVNGQVVDKDHPISVTEGLPFSGDVVVTNRNQGEEGKLYLKKVWSGAATPQDIQIELWKTGKIETNPTYYDVKLNGEVNRKNVPARTKVTIEWNVTDGYYLNYWIEQTNESSSGSLSGSYSFILGNIKTYNNEVGNDFHISTDGTIVSINVTYEEPAVGGDVKVGDIITISSADNWEKTIDLTQDPYSVDLTQYDVYVKEVTSTNAYEVTYEPDGISGQSGVVTGGQLITVTNTAPSTGSLSITKNVTVNGTSVSDHTNTSPADGDYIFSIAGSDPATTVVQYVQIRVTNGQAESYKVSNILPSDWTTITDSTSVDENGGAVISGLVPGDYVITELSPTNGTILTNVKRGDSNGDAVNNITKAVTVTVTAGSDIGEMAQAIFTNNTVFIEEPHLEKTVYDINDSTGKEGAIENSETSFHHSADYDINDVIPYRIVCNIPSTYKEENTYKFTIHDTMEHLSYQEGKVYFAIYHHDTGETVYYEMRNDAVTITPSEVSNDTQTVTVTLTKGDLIKTLEECKGYTVSTNPHDLEHPNSIPAGTGEGYQYDPANDTLTHIVFRYNAKLDAEMNPVIGSEGNKNDAYFTYGFNGSSQSNIDRDRVFTYRLQVNKVDENGNPKDGAEFTLSKKSYVDNKFYAVPVTVQKSNDGTVFTWDGIDDGVYKLEEVNAPAGYRALASMEFEIRAYHNSEYDPSNPASPELTYMTVTPSSAEGYTLTAEQESGRVTGVGKIVAVNKPAEIKIIKVDEETRGTKDQKPLSGAVFKLYKADDKGTKEGDPVQTATTNANGEVYFSNLELPAVDGEWDYYMIEETTAPVGYIGLSKPIYFAIFSYGEMWLADFDEFGYLAPDEYYSFDDNNLPVTLESGSPDYTLAFTVGNTPGAQLPATGGPGTVLYKLFGSILILSAALLLMRRRSNRRVDK